MLDKLPKDTSDLFRPVREAEDVDLIVGKISEKLGYSAPRKGLVESFTTNYFASHKRREVKPEVSQKDFSDSMEFARVMAQNLHLLRDKRIEYSSERYKIIILNRLEVCILISAGLFGVFPSMDLLKIFQVLNFTLFETVIFYLKYSMTKFDSVYKRLKDESIDNSEIEKYIANCKIGKIIIRLENVSEYYWEKNDNLITNLAIQHNLNVFSCVSDIICNSTDDNITGDMYNGFISEREKVFVNMPECFVIKLFIDKLSSDSVLSVLGCELMSQPDRHPKASDGTIGRAILFLNATNNTYDYTEYTTEFIRDLSKVTCGLSIFEPDDIIISSQEWKSSSGGNRYIKFIQLILATCFCGHKLILHTDDKQYISEITDFMNCLTEEQVTVKRLYELFLGISKMVKRDAINGYNQIDLKKIKVFDLIKKEIVN